MASCTCHAVCGATRVRLERIVRQPLAAEDELGKWSAALDIVHGEPHAAYD
jgi:hypothetical protein